MKAVFVAQQNPSYDDVPGERYHFPRRYLRAVEATIGDSIVYYESGRVPGKSRRAGRMAYFGVARVRQVDADNSKSGHFYAKLEEFLPFANLVPLRVQGQLLENSLNSSLRAISGAAQSAVRSITDFEFENILRMGFSETTDVLPVKEYEFTGFAEPPSEIVYPRSMEIYQRQFRDKIFSNQIMTAYDKRCAVTGLRLVNGGGRAEAQAAHIVPVAERGPDLVQNGLSLSSTVHWMFDRGIISVADDMRILRVDRLIPPELERLVSRSEYLLAPMDSSQRPHPKFLRWHREHCFKGS